MNTALANDIIIACHLNGQEIPLKHGYPLRVVVQEWYSMAWVKWLKSITVIKGKFKGPLQDVDYHYYPLKDSDTGKIPGTYKHVNSTILYPRNLSTLRAGNILVEGHAWTGQGVVSDVEVSTDQGNSWKKAAASRYPNEQYSWFCGISYGRLRQKGNIQSWQEPVTVMAGFSPLSLIGTAKAMAIMP